MIELQNVTYRVRDAAASGGSVREVTIIDDVSLKIEDRFVAITGPNGIGKTT